MTEKNGRAAVYLIDCPDYGTETVERAFASALAALGGWETLLPDRGERILLKPNLLTRADPERAVTTHPAVFGAVCASLKRAGYEHLFFGDSPGVPHPGPEKIAEACGITAAAEPWGAAQADFSGGREYSFPDGKTAKSFIIANGVLSCDRIVNLCKLKTHMLERMTGAQKNLFGIVYGLNKGACHVKHPNAAEFAGMLADLNRAFPPVLHVMDAVDAMEGNGPHSGTKKHLGKLLVSTDPVALDVVACSLIALDPALVPTNHRGAIGGVGIDDPARIDVWADGERLTPAEVRKRYGDESFDVYRGKEDRGNIRQLRFLSPLLKKRPRVDPERCVGCGICVRSCPLDPKALAMPEGKRVPVYDYKRCIRCFCCQEMCPQGAISVKQPVLARLVDRNLK